MIIAKAVTIDGDLELYDVKVLENGERVETSRNESFEEFKRRIKEFLEERKEGRL